MLDRVYGAALRITERRAQYGVDHIFATRRERQSALALKRDAGARRGRMQRQTRRHIGVHSDTVQHNGSAQRCLRYGAEHARSGGAELVQKLKHESSCAARLPKSGCRK